MSYEYYHNLSSKQKDRICSGEVFQETIEELGSNDKLNSNNTANNSLKRHATSERPRHSDDEEQSNTNSYDTGWTTISTHKQKKKLNDKDERIMLNTTRTFTNSMHCRERQRTIITNENNQNQLGINHNDIRISNYELNYAAEYHYPPFKLECEPKLNDKRQGVKLVNELISYIKNDFLHENPFFSKPILIDVWWIDLEGNLRMIIKTTELYVYLCKKERYAKELINIKINPIPPVHLPYQHTIILKWIKHEITDQDINDELIVNYKSLHSISTMNGTLNERTRHVKIELLEKKDYETILNNKKINLTGQLYEVDEFLPAPRILICGKCNKPGHTKKACQSSLFDICRRCGGDRSKIEEHKQCHIKCHHCGAAHMSTDYKCPILDDYRRQLISELKKHPEKLPQHIQLFIPSEYRNQNDKTKLIQSKRVHLHSQQKSYNNNDHIQWPSLNQYPATKTTSMNQNLNDTIKSFSDELRELKKSYNEDQRRIEEKYKDHTNSIKQTLQIMQQQQQTQQQMITTITNSIKQIIFSTCTKTTLTVCDLLNKMKMQTKVNDFDENIQQLKNQTQCIKEAESLFFMHVNALDYLADKQNETLNEAVDNLFKDINV
ncbi:unnamed protein product [Rotaria magnacalcarata]